jgi:hypothetical protein
MMLMLAPANTSQSYSEILPNGAQLLLKKHLTQVAMVIDAWKTVPGIRSAGHGSLEPLHTGELLSWIAPAYRTCL